MLGNPLLALADIMAVLTGEPNSTPIRAGEIVATGTLTALHAVRVGETWSVAADGLPLDELHLRIC